MLVKVFGSAVYGVDALTITIEVDTPGGKPGYIIVGLPDNAVIESIERIISALKNTGLEKPRARIVVNMAPADIKKAGAAYDLPIAMGWLAATGQIPQENLDKYIMMGELSLDGTLQPIKGALPIAIQARAEKFKGLILPKQNAREAGLVNNLDVF
ncbi:MAG: magnesium chelatase, partial [Taibaiella sp.]|nr:magnesium chelatase [Taibaiella sp.]